VDDELQRRGQPVTVVAAGGITRTSTYDDRRLVTNSSGPEGTSSFTYDSTGRMTQRVDPAGTTGFTYNARSDLAMVTGTVTGGTRTLGYAPDTRQIVIHIVGGRR